MCMVLLDQQRLGGPAAEREVAVGVDPLDIEGGPQAILAGNVIPAQESPVGRQPQRG